MKWICPSDYKSMRPYIDIADKTKSKYLEMIVKTGLLEKVKVGRENFYINTKLFKLFLNRPLSGNTAEETIITER